MTGVRPLPARAYAPVPDLSALSKAVRDARATPGRVLTLACGDTTARVSYEHGEYTVEQTGSTWRSRKVPDILDALFFVFPEGATLRGK